ncbi:MAG: M14 family metallocarboxypeptidase [Aestuariibacter sp.]
MTEQYYPIGTPGKPWDSTEKAQWLSRQQVQRSYLTEVVDKLRDLPDELVVDKYGQLDYQAGSYPLLAVRTREWQMENPNILVTGGVHGYETSGVQGAIRFLQTKAEQYAEHFNLLIVPCISPWGYETINRWNPDAIDPNRSFANDAAEESRALKSVVNNKTWLAHIDLHETTDTDNSEFRPALAARDGVVFDNWHIPDGFYLVGNSENPKDEFQKAIIESVAKVTHIAPDDGHGKIIGEPVSQHGVINYTVKTLGLCASVTNAEYVTTTEVYPDSPKTNPENCNEAQVAAISGGLDYLKSLQTES